jgi:hypothetical protein
MHLKAAPAGDPHGLRAAPGPLGTFRKSPEKIRILYIRLYIICHILYMMYVVVGWGDAVNG